MVLTPQAKRRLADDHVGWLTTTTESGAPAPNPVWCVLDGDDVVAFTSEGALKVDNIRRQPLVSLHFNSDELGGSLVIISGSATASPGRASAVEAYRAKYEGAMRDLHQMSVEQFDAGFGIEIRIHPTKVRGT